MQWNIIIHDWFTTVPNSIDNLPDFSKDKWAKMFGTNTYHFTDGEVNDTMEEHNNWDFSTEELKAKAEALNCQGNLTTTIVSPANQSSPKPKTPTPPTSTVTIEEIVDQSSSQPTETKLKPQNIAKLPKQVPS